MKKILLLLALSMLTACFGGFGDPGSSGSSNGSIDQNDFYLGSDFTIDSFYGKTFQNQTGTLNYTAEDVNPTGQTVDGIAGDLRGAIESKLDTNNDINYNLKTHSIDGDIESKRLVITYPITISTKGGNQSLSDTYSFTINFNNETTPPSGNLDFSLGDEFTIKSINKKYFTQSTSTIYVVDDINPVDKTQTDIIDELEKAIHVKHRPNSNISYTLDEPTTEGSVTQNQNFIVKFGIEISEQGNSNNSRNGTYSFTIKFNGETTPPPFEVDFDLGSTFTIPSFTDELFMSTDDKFLNYSIGNIDPETIVKDNIAGELTTAINAVHSVNDKINYTLGEPQKDITVQQMTVTFPITISEKANGNNSKNGAYTFTIKFAGPTVPWDGETFTKPNISDGYYLIKIPANLAWLGEQTEPIKTNVKFMNDINMGSNPFKGIVEFTGIFDGNNKTIRNISITTTDTTPAALIKTVVGDTTIKNLSLVGGEINGTDNVSAFIGVIYGRPNTPRTNLIIDNSTTDLRLTINSDSIHTYISGFVAIGHYTNITITNSKNTGAMYSNITGTDSLSLIGGFIGYILDGEIYISNSINAGEISSNSMLYSVVGGFISTLYGGDITIMNSKNVANITNTTNTVDNSIYIGGIVGRQTTGTMQIVDTFNSGDLKSEGNKHYTGGIIGETASSTLNLINVFNLGNISNTAINGYIGGIIGHNNAIETDNTTSIKNSYSYANIIATGRENSTGAIIGKVSGTITPTYTNNYWYAPTSNPTSNTNAGKKLTADEFKDYTKFVNWNFEDKWIMLQGALYPTLISNPEVVTP